MLQIRQLRLSVALSCILCICAVCTNALHIVAITSGSTSNLLTIAALQTTATLRGHTALVLVDSASKTLCEQIIGRASCLQVACGGGSCRHGFSSFLDAPHPTMKHQRIRPDVIVAADRFDEAEELSQHYNAPLVVLEDGSTSVGMHLSATWIPSSLTNASNSSFFSSVVLAFNGFVTDVISNWRYSRERDIYRRHHVLLQGLPWAGNFAPSCPNIHKLGFVRQEAHNLESQKRFAALQWAQECSAGFIYASVDSTGLFTAEAVHDTLARVARTLDVCVLWYSSNSTAAHIAQDNARVEVTHDILLSPPFALYALKPAAVLLSFSSENIQGAVFAGSRALFLGDSGALCSQAAAAGIGHCTLSREPRFVSDMLVELYNRTAYEENALALQRLGYVMGGSAKAVDTLELVAKLGSHNDDFFCDTAVFYSSHGFTAMAICSLSFFLSSVVSLAYWFCSALMRRRPARSSASKKPAVPSTQQAAPSSASLL